MGYLNRISGPLLDRMDIEVEVPHVEYKDMAGDEPSESSAAIKERVEAARRLQIERYGAEGIFCNAGITPQMLRKYCVLTPAAERILSSVYDKMGLSGRSYDRILKVARTIADLDRSESVNSVHIAEAVQFRKLDRKYWQSDIADI